jgi:hypothetical protein
MRRRRRYGNHSLQKNNLIQNSVGNDKNGYPAPDLNNTIINVTQVLSDAHKKPSKKKCRKKSLRYIWRRY